MLWIFVIIFVDIIAMKKCSALRNSFYWIFFWYPHIFVMNSLHDRIKTFCCKWSLIFWEDMQKVHMAKLSIFVIQQAFCFHCYSSRKRIQTSIRNGFQRTMFQPATALSLPELDCSNKHWNLRFWSRRSFEERIHRQEIIYFESTPISFYKCNSHDRREKMLPCNRHFQIDSLIGSLV